MLSCGILAQAVCALAAGPIPQGEVLETERQVQYSARQTNWVPATTGLKLRVEDRLRTLALSRAMVQLADLGRLRVNELTTLEILPPPESSSKATLDLKAGARAADGRSTRTRDLVVSFDLGAEALEVRGPNLAVAVDRLEVADGHPCPFRSIRTESFSLRA